MVKWYAGLENGNYISKTWPGTTIPAGPRAMIQFPVVSGKEMAKCSFWESENSEQKYCNLFNTEEEARRCAEELFTVAEKRNRA